jgi:hypothetical protein
MSEIRVGDILIKGDKITFNASEKPQPVDQLEISGQITLLAQISAWPLPEWLFPSAGIFAWVLGVLSRILFGHIPVLGWIIPVPFFLIGLCLFVLAFLISREHEMGRRMAAQQQQKLLESRFSLLKPFLLDSDPSHTVEWLVKQTGMTDLAVLQTLQALIQQGVVEEDFSGERKQWYYYLRPEEDGKSPFLNVEKRLNQYHLEERNEK